MVGRQTTTPRPNGFGTTMRSQVRSTQRRVVCAAQGSTGAPDSAASCATPGGGDATRPARAVRA